MVFLEVLNVLTSFGGNAIQGTSSVTSVIWEPSSSKQSLCIAVFSRLPGTDQSVLTASHLYMTDLDLNGKQTVIQD